MRDVQIGGWFVEQQHVGLRREAARDDDTLAFTAGQPGHRAPGEMPHIRTA